MSQDPKRQLAEQALKEIWGYDTFRPLQWQSIETVLAGKDSLTVLPTGGGKSLCYQLPAVLGNGTALVVSPLIALMADQVRALDLFGIPAGFLNSSQSQEESRDIWVRMMRGELKVLYAAPERLLTEGFLEALKKIKLCFIAIDEAHCISQWGHDFRPEYRRLHELRDHFPHIGFHAFTATASPQVQQDIGQQLNLRDPEILVGDYFRPNLHLSVMQRQGKKQLLELIGSHPDDHCGIVYCLTRKNTEAVAEFLNDEGISAKPYHAGLSNELRSAHQKDFAEEKVRVMVATVAFGMGVDQSNIRFVIHFGMPQTLSHYQQEAGRAGRDGLLSQCTLLFNMSDFMFWKRIVEQESGSEFRLPQLQAMLQYASQPICRHKQVISYFGQEFDKEDGCQACDVCAGRIKSHPESRRIAQMILSAVLRVDQHFGAEYVSQVLSGSKNHRLSQFGHDKLSVYGLLKNYSIKQIRDWISQLEGQGYLVRDTEAYNALKLSHLGFCLLKPEKYDRKPSDLSIYLLVTTKQKRPEQKKDTSHPLFEPLRILRRQISLDRGVPPFVIFNDKVLAALCDMLPTNRHELLQVPGIGQHKADQFGEDILEEIQVFLEEQSD